MKTLEELIEEIGNAGFWINNLFQLEDSSWRANIKTMTPIGTRYFEFANGATAREALELAHAVALGTAGELVKPKAQGNSHLRSRAKVKSKLDLDLSEILDI